MEIIIQKFGGTSLHNSKVRAKAVKEVVKKYLYEQFPVVVVSAMGREGSPYSTDTLINLPPETEIDNYLRENDLIMSCGEIISTVVFVKLLKDIGLKARALTGWQAGIKTNADFGSAQIDNVNPKRIYKLLDEGIIPVIAGFQGATEDNEITTIGRGGSDATASLLGSVLSAKSIFIYTDVDGIMSADPLLVKNTRKIPFISYERAQEAAQHGLKVIHPYACEIAANSQIPLHVMPINSEQNGTLIYNKNYKINIFSIKDYKDYFSEITILFFRPDINKMDIIEKINKLFAENYLEAKSFQINKWSIVVSVAIDKKIKALNLLHEYFVIN